VLVLLIAMLPSLSICLPTDQAPPGSFAVWLQEALRKVGRADEPAATRGVFTIRAARNEFEPFQLVLRASGDLPANLSMIVADLEGPKGAVIRATNISVRRGQFIAFVEPSDPAKKYQRIRYAPKGSALDAAVLEDGTAEQRKKQAPREAAPAQRDARTGAAQRRTERGPTYRYSVDGVSQGWVRQETLDLLENETGFNYDKARKAKIGTLGESLSAGERNRVYWITVYVPPDAIPGEYRGEIRIGDGQNQKKQEYRLLVWNFALPRNASFNLSLGVPRSGPSYSRSFTDQNFFEHRAGLRDLGVDPKLSFDAKDEPVIDWTEFDRRAHHVLDELSMTHLEAPHAYVIGGHGDVNRNLRPGLKEGEYAGMRTFGGYLGVPYYPKDEQFAKYHDPNRGGADGMDETFKRRFRNYLFAFARHTKERGWFRHFVLNLFDEPLPRSYDQLRALALLAKQADAEYTIMTDGANPTPELVGYFDMWSGYYRPNQRDLDLNLLRERQDFGEPYRSGNPWNDWMINRSPLYVRAYPWWAWVEKIDGAGSWTIADWSWINLDSDAINTHELFWSFLVYPPRKGEDRYHASVRWEMTREGQEDYEYFVLLQNLLARKLSGNLSRPEAQARDEVTQKLTRIIQPNWSRVEDPDLMYQIRAELASSILRLQGDLQPQRH
jgi:hypothetical protein